jgi:hypothetical protein
MAKAIGHFSNFSNICLHALRAYHQLLRKFYGPENPLNLKTDRLVPPPHELLLVPINAEKFHELAALSQKLESATGKPVSIEQLMARAVAAIPTAELENLPDPFPDIPPNELFRIYSEHLQEIPT